MKWDILQGDIIKKLYSGAQHEYYYIEGQERVHYIGKYSIFRIPLFFCYVAFPPMWETKRDLLLSAWNASESTLLTPRRMELRRNKKCQIFVNAETDEEICVDTTLYSKYVEKADQISFWGTDRKSPVFGINGEAPDKENIVFMVLPIV